MPYDDPDPDDPMTLTGITLDTPAVAVVEAAHVIAEELARSGRDRDSIMRTFRTPEYRGPHSAYRALGEKQVREIVDENCAVFEACRAACKRD